jgi:plastocyanin
MKLRSVSRAATVSLIAFSLALPPVAAASAPGDRGASEVRRVRMVDAGVNRFRPGRLTVDRGTRIRWVNAGSLSHTTTSDDGDWDRRLSPGDTFTRRFRRAGTFSYRCTIHPEMRGTIVVE